MLKRTPEEFWRAGKQVGKQAGRLASRQASKQAGKQFLFYGIKHFLIMQSFLQTL